MDPSELTPTASAIHGADTAWMIAACAMVLLMTPALAFFYGGLVRSKNALNTMMMSFAALGTVGGLTITRAQGHGGELESVETYRGTTVKMELVDKVRLDIGVSDAFVEPTIEALISAARTGEVGDGKIFVVPVEKAVRIRTGEVDVAAVTPALAVAG